VEAAAAGPDDALAPLCYIAAASVRLHPEQLRASIRRALFVLAAGGDPHRDVDPRGPAVGSLAADLDEPDRRAELAAALADLHARAQGLANVEAALETLRADPDGAWRWLAAALLADELSSD
jgi:hypothetical protein